MTKICAGCGKEISFDAPECKAIEGQRLQTSVSGINLSEQEKKDLHNFREWLNKDKRSVRFYLEMAAAIGQKMQGEES